MSRPRFPLSSDLLELLLAFEEREGLESLAHHMGKDVSVISRNLQKIAETLPVIEKKSRRWGITALGVQVNALTRRYLHELAEMKASDRPSSDLPKKSLLLVINAQRGLLDPARHSRSNLGAEANILAIIQAWRAQARPIAYIQHVSDNPASRFFRGSEGAILIPSLAPLPSEWVIEKQKSSAFSNPQLLDQLQKQSIDGIVLTGFTANECIDATARDSSELGFSSYVIDDATATFDLAGPDGKIQKAERVHQLVIANLHAYYAKILSTRDLLRILQ